VHLGDEIGDRELELVGGDARPFFAADEPVARGQIEKGRGPRRASFNSFSIRGMPPGWRATST